VKESPFPSLSMPFDGERKPSVRPQQAYRIAAATGIHRGDRDYQQDQVQLIQHPRHSSCLLAVLADGMGSRSGGRTAADQVMLTARQLFERFDPYTDNPSETLLKLVKESHTVIRLTAVSADQEPHSTLVAALVMPDRSSHWVHAGDSRIYHFRQGRMVHRTLDHSYVQNLINQGQLTEAEAHNHPHSNILMGCLGTDAEPPMDVHHVPEMLPGDSLLLCSDGLWHYFMPNELGNTLHLLPPREACELLIGKARTRAEGGGDNLSLAIIRFEPL
jgi:serine/threonine protein phosphatase PrpC